MSNLRKYWFVLLLLATLAAIVIALLDPPLEKEIGIALAIIWIGSFFANIFWRLEAVERKLSSIAPQSPTVTHKTPKTP